MDAAFAASVSQLHRSAADHRSGSAQLIGRHGSVGLVDEATRKANIRLAVILGLVALGFYLLMIFFNPQ